MRMWCERATNVWARVGLMMGLGLLGGVPLGLAETTNRIVAVVNEDIITEADVTFRVQSILSDERAPAAAGEQTASMRHAILERLIEQRLMLQQAKQEDLVISSSEILQQLESAQRQFPSLEAFRASLAQAGFSEEQFKAQIRDQLLIRHVIDTKVRATIQVSPQDIARTVAEHPELLKPGDRVRASHLLIRVHDRRSEQEARALIEEIRQKSVEGADFAALAKRYSEDAQREAGGAMDWVAPGELLPELDTVLFRLPVGEISPPIQTRLGFHVLKIEERRPAASLTVEESNRVASQRIYQEKFRQAMAQWLKELKQHAYIHLADDVQ